MNSIEWNGQALILLDQTKLPVSEEYIHCTDWRQVAEAIKMLRVRGAPAIGVAAGYALVLAAREAATHGDRDEQFTAFFEFANTLKATRPTAINLAWAVERVCALVHTYVTTASQDDQTVCLADCIDRIEAEAIAINKEDLALNSAMAKAGAGIFEGRRGLRILTHCNAGALATAGIGTALGVVRELHANGQLSMVYADETRPLLQGARLTTFELHQDGIPVTLLTDNMAAYAMQQGLIDAVIVGADRITTEGDVANKIGTYGVAVLAKAHGIPFYVAAPYSTFDFTLASGKDIPIEIRESREVTHFQGCQTAPDGVPVLNPAFDVTPHEYVSAIITEAGVLYPDYTKSIAGLHKEVQER